MIVIHNSIKDKFKVIQEYLVWDDIKSKEFNGLGVDIQKSIKNTEEITTEKVILNIFFIHHWSIIKFINVQFDICYKVN